MNAIEKAKEALREIINQDVGTWDKPVPFSVLHTRAVDIARDTLATLEAEKPAEDALELASKIEHGAHDYAEFWCRVLPQWLESYAEAYHEKKCAECKKVEPRKYYPLGQEPMSSHGAEHGYEENDE